jgi:hypothetical protein
MRWRWFIRLLEYLHLRCRHEDVFIETIHEQSLRGGYAHWSNVFKCQKCGRFSTHELDL